MIRLVWLFIASTAFCALYGQDSAPPLKFEVASVRLSDPQSANDRITYIQSDSRRIDYHFMRIEQLVTHAWPLHQNQIVWPESLATQADRSRAHYDISATMPEGTSKEQQ